MDYYQYHTYAWDGSFDGHSPFEVSIPFYQYAMFFTDRYLMLNTRIQVTTLIVPTNIVNLIYFFYACVYTLLALYDYY